MFHLDAVSLVLKEHSKIYQPSPDSIRQPLDAAQGRVVLFRTDMWKSNQTLNYMAGFLCLHLFKVLSEPQWNNRAVCKSPWKTSFITKFVETEQTAEGLPSQWRWQTVFWYFQGSCCEQGFAFFYTTAMFQTLNIWTLDFHQRQTDRKGATQMLRTVPAKRITLRHFSSVWKA